MTLRIPALGLVLALALGPAAGNAASKCAAAKVAATGAGAACAIALEAKEAKKGVPPDPAKLARCADRRATAFEKAERKTDCLTTGDAAALGTRIDDFAAELDAALSVGTPSACQARKLGAAAQGASCLLRLAGKAAKKDAPANPQKEAACRAKLAAAYARFERKPCGTTADAAAIQTAVDAFVSGVEDALVPAPGPGLDGWTYVEASASHQQTFGLAFGDLDGDDLADVVSGPYWYRNPGGDLLGTWTQSPAFPGGVHAMLAVDVDGDAFADVIAQSDSGATVLWLEATNAGATAWSTTAIGTLPASSHSIGMQGYRVAQLEAGGRPEIAFSSGGGVFYFLIPGSNPEAGSWTRVRVSQNPSDEGFAVGDVDVDGDLDVAAGTGATLTVEWYENPGTGAADWTAHELGDVSDFVYPDRFELADMDGDDDLDVVASEENGLADDAKTVWFAQPDAAPTANGWTRTPIATQGSTNSLDVADMDEDGDADVVTGEHRGDLRVRIFENDGTGTAFTPHEVDEGRESHLGARVVDLDGDEDLDIVSIAYDAPQYVHVWRNDGPDIPFEYVIVDDMDETHGYLDDKGIADLNLDGLPDLVLGTEHQLYWYPAPTFERTFIAPGANFTTDMQVGDVDGDGDIDLIVAEYEIHQVSWFRNPEIGGGAWSAVPIGTGRAHDLEVADMNNDAKLDVVIRGHFLATTLFLQQTPSTWTAVTLPEETAIHSEGLHLADLNGDTRKDIVQNGYWIEAPLDPSNAGAWEKHEFDTSWEASTVAVGVVDLNEDSRPDVILAFGEQAGELAWYEAPADPENGPGWIKHPIASPVDFVHTFKVADMDGDSRPDIVFAEMLQSAGKRVGIFRNGGLGASWRLQVVSTGGSHNIRVGDLGADGDLDIYGANWQIGSLLEVWENQTNP